MANVSHYTESYGVGPSTLKISVYANTGSATENGRTVNAHSMEAYIDGAFQFDDNTATDTNVAQRVQSFLSVLRNSVDSITNEVLHNILTVDLASLPGGPFVADLAADAPTGFTATPGATGIISIDWDSIPGVTYTVQRATDAGFSVALTTIGAGATDPFPDTGLTSSTHYYYRIKAVITGLSDSSWTMADAIAP